MVALVCCSLCTFLPAVFVMFPCARKDKRKLNAVVPKNKDDPKKYRNKSKKHYRATPKNRSKNMQKNEEKNNKVKSKKKPARAAVAKQETKPVVQPKICDSNKKQKNQVAQFSDAELVQAINHSKGAKKGKQEVEAVQVESESNRVSSESEENITSKRLQADETKEEERDMQKTLEEYKDLEEEPSDMNQEINSNKMSLTKKEMIQAAKGKRVKKRLDERALFEEDKRKRREMLQQQRQKPSEAPPKESSSSNRKKERNSFDAAKEGKGLQSKKQKRDNEDDQGIEKNKQLKSSSSSRNKETSGVEGNTTGMSGSADASSARQTSSINHLAPHPRKLNRGDDVMPRKRALKKRMDELDLYKHGNPKELKRLGFMAPKTSGKQEKIETSNENTGTEMTSDDARAKNE